MAEYSLSTSTMLVEFNASVWTARILDKKVTGEVCTDKSAKSGAARVNKSLMAGRNELAEIQALVTEARTYVYANTAPWSDAGQRWLPTARLIKFDHRMDDFKARFMDLVENFVGLYPTLITAQAMTLGDMFNRDDFPAASEIARKFAFSYDFFPLPSARDFRVDISNDAQRELQARLEETMKKRVDNALGDVQERLVDHLKRMSDRLVTEYDNDGKPKARKFHHTLVDGAFELCDLVKDINVTGDKRLADARIALENALAGCTADSLRADEGKREDVKKEVDSLLGLFNFKV